ncbi:MAG: hypothetical protein COU25_01530 [Candidatus Levybacteria bacterium CG10_big_fil_rev_8_21_14_0_10_35_13]|nr:MAG: hypothetical protein COU25_01530 [Candidatus Levybacteria bacterium CG10_big_fil_rev_8_21_14_0_10_35_13]
MSLETGKRHDRHFRSARRLITNTLGASVLAASLYGSGAQAQSPSLDIEGCLGANYPAITETVNTEVVNLKPELRLASPENEICHTMDLLGYMSYVPDGPITFWTTAEGKKRYLLTGGDFNPAKEWTGNATYLMETDGSVTLRDAIASGEMTSDNFLQVFTPDLDVQYRRHYVGITSVFQTDPNNLDHLWGITHAEERTDRNASGDYTSTVGLVESTSGGLTWEDRGILITGTDVKAPGGGRVSGAGQPSAIYNAETDYINGLYIEWPATIREKTDPDYKPDQIYAFRMKVNEDGSPGPVEYWTENGFSETKENLKPAIPVPEDKPEMIYTALPHLSWNTELNQYIAVGESDNGFWFSKSDDLVTWSSPEIVYDFIQYGGQPHSILQVGGKWDSYPSLLDESQPSSQITGKNGTFVHSSGDNRTAHEPATLDATIVAK